MIVIGVDPHKCTHTAVAVDGSSRGRVVSARCGRATTVSVSWSAGRVSSIRARHDPATAAYIAKQRARGKTNKEAIRLLKRHLVNRVWRLLQADAQPEPHTITC
jgi:hypothetical protein